MRLRTVPAADLPRVWPMVAPWLAAVVARRLGEMSLDDLRGICAREEGALVLICGAGDEAVAAGVTQVREHEGGGRSCCILALGGSGARDWCGTLGVIEANAARIGCETVRFEGRAGWARLLPDYECRVSYAKRLPAVTGSGAIAA